MPRNPFYLIYNDFKMFINFVQKQVISFEKQLFTARYYLNNRYYFNRFWLHPRR